jgi:PAS domain S-box-containing protein
MTTPFQALYYLARDLHHSHLDAHQITQTALQHIAEIIGTDQVGLVTFRNQPTIQDAHIIGHQMAGQTIWQILLTQGLIGYVYYDERVVIIHDISTDSRWPNHPQLPQTGSAIGIPLLNGQFVSAVLLVLHPEREFFSAEKVELLEEVSELLSAALNNSMAYRGDNEPERHYFTLFDNAIVPIILTNLNGEIININQHASQLLGYFPHDLINQPISRIHPKLDVNSVYEGYPLTDLPINHENIIQTELYTYDKTQVPVLVRLRRLQIDGRDLIEWLQQDISAQMTLEQLRRDLSAMIYHDLRGPLHTLGGSIRKLSQLLANYDEPAVLNLLQVGLRSSRQLRRMVDSLLDVQRLEEGNRILNLSKQAPHALLTQAYELVQPLAVEAEIRLRYDVVDDLPPIYVDNDMMTRVVINLLENAIKYTPSGETIALIVRSRDNHLVVRVKDNGPGIPPDMVDKIFDKFNRVSYSNAPKGVGLGLAFCRLAVQAHGGEIWVESKLNEGSDFYFTLPYLTAPMTNHAPLS